MRLPFHQALKRLLVNAFSSTSVSPAVVVQRLMKSVYRPCSKQEGQAFLEWLECRGISRLVHFTPLSNVPKIMQFGLIPREYLELELVQLALGSQFTDGQRLEGLPHYSCLSITSPNYAMFYGKRNTQGGKWAVLEYDARVLSRFHFSFTPTNAAASGTQVASGVAGAEQLFTLPMLREKLALQPSEPTDPQAESLCDSVLGPEYVTDIYVEQQLDVQWLAGQGIHAKLNRSFFMPRRDYKSWQGRRITQLLEWRLNAAELPTGGDCGQAPRLHF